MSSQVSADAGLTPEPPQAERAATEAPTGADAEDDLFNLDSAKVSQALKNDAAPEASLNAKVVTAAGGADEERSLAAADITVVDQEEISAHGWRSLAEVLANVPGLYVTDDLVLPSVGVRGVSGGLNAGTRILKIMINGVAVSFRPELSALIGPELIPMEAVERIEVAKGPLSALYGANAFLAVVNVITRRATAGLGAEVALHAGADRQYPSDGISGLTAYHDHGVSLSVAASAYRLERSGLGVSQTFPAQIPTSSRYAPFFGAGLSHGDLALPMSVYAQLSSGARERGGELTLQGGYQRLDSMGEFQLNSVLTNQSRISLENFWTNARYEKAFSSAWALAVSAGYSEGAPTRDYRLLLTNDLSTSYHPNFNYNALDAAAELNFNPGPALGLKLGVDGEVDRETVLYYTQTLLAGEGQLPPGTALSLLKSTETLQQDINDLGLYLQATSVPIAKLPGLHLTGNLRVDKPNLFDYQFSWRAAAAYRFNRDLTIKLFAGRAFQAPSGVLLFAEGGFGQTQDLIGARSQPSLPSLVPQVIQSVEANLAAKLAGRISLDLGAFAQQIDNHISFVTSANRSVASNGVPGTTDSTATQQQDVGADLSVRAYVDRFSLYLSASVVEAFFGGQLSSEPPPLYPNLFGRAGTDVAIPELHVKLTAQVRAVGARGSSDSNTLLNALTPYTLPPYADIDFAISSADLHLLGDRTDTQIRLAVFNLADERHSEPGFGGVDVPNLGRVVAAELRQVF